MDSSRAAAVNHPATAKGVPLFAVMVAVTMWSLSALTIRAAHADPLRYVAWRALLSLPVLGLILAVRSRRRSAPLIVLAPGVTPVRWLLTIVGAGAVFTASAVLGFGAVNRTALLDNAIISSLQPILVVAAAVLFLGEASDHSNWVRAGAAVVGTILVVTANAAGAHHDAIGIAMAVAALGLNVIWYLYGRWLRSTFDVDPVALMLGVLTSVAVILTPIAWISAGTMYLPLETLGWATTTMVVGTGAHLCSMWAHRYVPASISSLFLLAQAPIIGLAAWWAFGERPAAIQVVGTIVVLGALAGVVRSQTIAHVDETVEDSIPAT